MEVHISTGFQCFNGKDEDGRGKIPRFPGTCRCEADLVEEFEDFESWEAWEEFQKNENYA
jgi:hypothetical protein